MISWKMINVVVQRKMIHRRTCALLYHIKGPITVNEAKIGLFRKIANLQLEVH